MKKKLSLVLAIIIVFCLVTTASASSNSTVSDSSYITAEDCILAGKKWIAANYPQGTEIESVIPIMSLSGQLSGYCINFIRDSQPAGYLVLNASKYSRTYIREFALDGAGLYDQLCENGEVCTTEEIIYSTNPYEYAVKFKTDNQTFFYNTNSTILSFADELASYCITDCFKKLQLNTAEVGTESKESLFDAFFNGSSLTDYSFSNSLAIAGSTAFTPFLMSDLVTGENTGNCGPTAVANICGYYNSRGLTNIYLNGNIEDTYDALVSAVNFDIDGTSGAYYSNLKTGLSSYVRSRSYEITINSYWLHLWSDFKRDFDDGKPNLIFIQGYTLENGSWVTAGHFVVGIGYRITNDGTRYIRVYDGWNATSSRFILFDSDILTEFKGASVYITE